MGCRLQRVFFGRSLTLLSPLVLLAPWLWAATVQAEDAPRGRPLPGTRQLEAKVDLAEQMVAGIDRFLLREIESSVARRVRHWRRDFSSPQSYSASVAPNRARLAKMIGAVDSREKAAALELVAT